MATNSIERGLSVLEEYFSLLQTDRVPPQDASVFGCTPYMTLADARNFYNALDRHGKSGFTGRVRDAIDAMRSISLDTNVLRDLVGLPPKEEMRHRFAYAQ